MNESPTVGPRVQMVPAGDQLERLVCPECRHVEYVNPKVVVGAVATWEDRILLCRRAISPRRGFWTLPAGYLELNETPEAGVLREAWEEARARLAIDALLAVYTVKRASQIQLIYRAAMASPDIAAGPESLDVRLWTWEDLPWESLAFPTVAWALHDYRETKDLDVFGPRANPPGDPGQAEYVAGDWPAGGA